MDRLNVDCMTSYHDLEAAYRSYSDDRRLLHNFPAEVNAAYYEQRLVEQLRVPYRTFSPRVVFMLEHRDWVRQFTRCWAYGLVEKKKDERRNPFWALDLPACEYDGQRFRADLIELSEHTEQGQPELLRAMDTFVFRQKDFRPDLEIPIVHDRLVAALIQAENAVGDDGANIERIRSFIEGDQLRQLKRSQKQFESDLGDLMHLILVEEIDRLSVE
jgi:hypothetical protein